MNPRVVHCKKDRYDVYIGRPSKWGNPFVLRDPNDDEQRRVVIEKHKEWLLKQPELLKQLPELKGKTLACFCAPKPCHGDILLELANKN